MAREPSTAPENEVDIEQENVGRENMQGSGEWPDPETGTPPAGTFKEVLEADPVLGGSSTGLGSEGADSGSAEKD
jgi:hypothetical protein